MPDYLKISELPVASALALTDQFEVNQSGTSRSVTSALVQSVRQTVSFQTGAAATGTTLIPFDNTIPQITEGDQYMTLAITPRSATSRLVIHVTWIGKSSVINDMGVALFQDVTVNALAAGHASVAINTATVNISFTHVMTSGTTSATTFRVRAGGALAGTTSFNGGSVYGGVMASSIVIQEVL
jgi:hypothetical protein